MVMQALLRYVAVADLPIASASSRIRLAGSSSELRYMLFCCRATWVSFCCARAHAVCLWHMICPL